MSLWYRILQKHDQVWIMKARFTPAQRISICQKLWQAAIKASSREISMLNAKKS